MYPGTVEHIYADYNDILLHYIFTASSFKIRRFVGDYDKLWQYIDMFDMPGEYLRTHTDQQGKAIIGQFTC